MPPTGPPDHLTALAERVIPLFNEYGVTGFVLIGYHDNGEGARNRICIVQTGRDPAIEDGLRPIINFAQMWGAPPQQFVPPPQDDPR